MINIVIFGKGGVGNTIMSYYISKKYGYKKLSFKSLKKEISSKILKIITKLKKIKLIVKNLYIKFLITYLS